MSSSTGGRHHRTGILHRVGVAAARHRWLVLTAWSAFALLGLVQLPQLLGPLDPPPIRVDSSQSARAEAAMAEHFPDLGREQMLVVLRNEHETATEPGFARTAVAVMTALRQRREVTVVVPLPPADLPTGNIPAAAAGPLWELRGLYRDSHNSYILVTVSGTDGQRLRWFPEWQAAVEQAIRDTSAGHVTGYLVGYTAAAHELQQLALTDVYTADAIAMPAAFLLLLLGLGCLGAAAVPAVVAGVAISGTLCVLDLLPAVNATQLMVVSMVGLGVGIDYCLLVVSRFREELARGLGRTDALGHTTATAGRTVAYSGIAVMLATSSALLIDNAAVRAVAASAITVTAISVVAALTLLPALLATSRPWLDRGTLPWRTRPHATATAGEQGRWARWARHVMRRPWRYGTTVVVLLALAAAPSLDLRLSLELPEKALADTAFGRGMAVLTDDKGADGGNLGGFMPIVVQTPAHRPVPDTTALVSALRADPRIATALVYGTRADTTLVLAVPKISPTTPEAAALVRYVRHTIVPRTTPPDITVLVGGPPAVVVDLAEESTSKLWWVIGFVLAVSLLLLMVLLRSVLLPIKAIIMNILVTAATYGLVVVVFQNGIGDELFGTTATGTTQVYLPIAVFVVLFGLSLDYEVFLIRRIQEEYEIHGDTERAVATGLQTTARPLATAAAIMIAVFASGLAAHLPDSKQLAFALAVAILLDATLVRFVLVPAFIKILGRWNWWYPQPLRRATRHHRRDINPDETIQPVR
ncbi:RND superfamily putative drug exporter [Lentzea atacamensis]|uniref:RND superfamily putative drug exporter n=1 Tax=Lentzea atacamensis TaxID=531938 RepID=A0ABX9EBB1_9PSEU|nr:RND superfamily putative drug exporter [Lentzea atacamensis]